MDEFTKWIKVGSVAKAFVFRKVYIANGYKFFVTTGDTKGSPLFFMIEMESFKWKIVDAPKVPEWIKHIEAALIEAINEKGSPAGN